MRYIFKFHLLLSIVIFSFVSVGYAATVHLEWNAPSDGGSVSGYNIYYGLTDNISEMTKITGITGTTYNLQGLELHNKYFFYVSAYNSIGEGPPSSVRVSNVSLRIVN